MRTRDADALARREGWGVSAGGVAAALVATATPAAAADHAREAALASSGLSGAAIALPDLSALTPIQLAAGIGGGVAALVVVIGLIVLALRSGGRSKAGAPSRRAAPGTMESLPGKIFAPAAM
jgi:hypothetical protein